MQERNYMLIATNCLSDFRHGAEQSELVLDRGGRSQPSSTTSRVVSRDETRSGATSGRGGAPANLFFQVLNFRSPEGTPTSVVYNMF
jgi:hypothetical protein